MVSDGAEVILKIRAVVVNGDLDDYMTYYKNRYRAEHHLSRYDEDTSRTSTSPPDRNTPE